MCDDHEKKLLGRWETKGRLLRKAASECVVSALHNALSPDEPTKEEYEIWADAFEENMAHVTPECGPYSQSAEFLGRDRRWKRRVSDDYEKNQN